MLLQHQFGAPSPNLNHLAVIRLCCSIACCLFFILTLQRQHLMSFHAFEPLGIHDLLMRMAVPFWMVFGLQYDMIPLAFHTQEYDWCCCRLALSLHG